MHGQGGVDADQQGGEGVHRQVVGAVAVTWWLSPAVGYKGINLQLRIKLYIELVK